MSTPTYSPTRLAEEVLDKSDNAATKLSCQLDKYNGEAATDNGID
jgi:hypothetical protein